MKRGILIVDDEELILSSIGRELRSWLDDRGLVLFPARSGGEALAFLEEGHRQVLVLVTDLKMPGMAGDELAASVRRRWPEIQTVLISGFAEMQGLSRAVAAGIRGFVPKPWEPESLTTILDQALAERLRLQKEGIQHNELTYQLARTAEMQRTLFRNDALDPQQFRRSVVSRPLEGQFCGGDFYEIVSLGPNRCVALLGDVSGHGVEAAFFTGVIHTLITQDEIYNLVAGSASAGYLLSRLNRLVFEHVTDQSRTVALSVLLLDREEGVVQVANAGGLPLLHVREGRGTFHHVPGFPLGLASETEYPVLTIPCLPGDRWVLMTDGLIDGGQEGFLPGTDVMRLVLEGLSAGGLEEVFQGFQRYRAGEPFLDDITLVSVEVV